MSPWRRLIGASLLLWLSGCTLLADPGRVAPGEPQAQVAQQFGQPTARYPAAGGLSERWQYSYQPSGQRVIDIDFDAQGRVTKVEQVLSEALFAQRIRPNAWTRADVLREYGPPARTMGVHNFKGDIWIWRYVDGVTWRLLFIDIDPAGVVRGWSNGDEDLPDPPDPK